MSHLKAGKFATRNTKNTLENGHIIDSTIWEIVSVNDDEFTCQVKKVGSDEIKNISQNGIHTVSGDIDELKNIIKSYKEYKKWVTDNKKREKEWRDELKANTTSHEFTINFLTL